MERRLNINYLFIKKMKKLTIAVLIGLNFFCLATKAQCNHQAYDDYLLKLYDRITQVQQRGKKKGANRFWGLSFDRRDADYFRNLNFSFQNDTVYMLEIAAFGDDGFLFTVWNRTDTIAGNYNSITEQWYARRHLFSKEFIELISDWNEKEIREREKIDPGYMSRSLLVATRIIFHQGKYKIDSFEFLDLEEKFEETLRSPRRDERKINRD